MKKLLLLSVITCTIISTAANAQSGPSPSASAPSARQQTAPSFTPEQQAAMVKEAKEKQVPMLVEKAGLTQAQAEKLIEINFEIRFQAGQALTGLNDAERSAKLAEFKALKEKKYSEIPLTADQIKAVYAAYEEMGRNMPKRN